MPAKFPNFTPTNEIVRFSAIHHRFMAHRLRLARLKKGYSQTFAAGVVGKRHATISDFENAKSIPKLGLLFELAQLYGVSIDYFLLTFNFEGLEHDC